MWTSIQCVFLWTSGECEGTGALVWASHSYTGSTRSFKTMPSMRLHLLGGVTWLLCPYLGALTSLKSHGLNTRCWLVEKNCAALWLVSTFLSLPYYLHLFHVVWSVPAKVFLTVTFSIWSILTDHDLFGSDVEQGQQDWSYTVFAVFFFLP